MALSLLLVSLFCFIAVPVSAGDTSKQGSTQLAAVEDPGNSGAPHNDDGAVGILPTMMTGPVRTNPATVTGVRGTIRARAVPSLRLSSGQSWLCYSHESMRLLRRYQGTSK